MEKRAGAMKIKGGAGRIWQFYFRTVYPGPWWVPFAKV
jgi:hypothetical protein